VAHSFNELNTITAYLLEIWKTIFTTNLIDPSKKGPINASFPTCSPGSKLIQQLVRVVLKKWMMAIQKWRAALNRFMIVLAMDWRASLTNADTKTNSPGPIIPDDEV
jgi:transposase-like protein